MYVRSVMDASKRERINLRPGGHPHACAVALLRIVRMALLTVALIFGLSMSGANAQAPMLRAMPVVHFESVDDHHLSCKCASCNPTKCCCVRVKSSVPMFRPVCALPDDAIYVTAIKVVPIICSGSLIDSENTPLYACQCLFLAAPWMLTKWSAPPIAQPPQA